jgi:hypothetical protein
MTSTRPRSGRCSENRCVALATASGRRTRTCTRQRTARWPKRGHRSFRFSGVSAMMRSFRRKLSRQGPSLVCNSKSSMVRMVSLDDATQRRSPSGATSMTPAVLTSRRSTHRVARRVKRSTASKSSSRLSANSMSVEQTNASLGIGTPTAVLGGRPRRLLRTAVVNRRQLDGKSQKRSRIPFCTITARHYMEASLDVMDGLCRHYETLTIEG